MFVSGNYLIAEPIYLSVNVKAKSQPISEIEPVSEVDGVSYVQVLAGEGANDQGYDGNALKLLTPKVKPEFTDVVPLATFTFVSANNVDGAVILSEKAGLFGIGVSSETNN